MLKLLAFFTILGFVNGGQLCMKCLYVQDPKDCYTITECGDHEYCSIEQYVISTEVLYDVGCKAREKCNAQVGLSPGKRDDSRFTACSECCNGTKACNILDGLCGTTKLDLHGGHLCFSCDQTLNDHSCSRITLCDQDQVCYVGQKIGSVIGDRLWEARCALPQTECPFGVRSSSSAAPLVGKRDEEEINRDSRASSGSYCSQCCRGNFCNNHCSTNSLFTTPKVVSTTAKPTPQPTLAAKTTPTTTANPFFKPNITDIGGIGSVHTGVDVRLFCSATGNPKPSIWWNLLQTDPNVKNYHIEGNGHILVIENYQAHNNGKYMCYAQNSVGTDQKIVTLHA